MICIELEEISRNCSTRSRTGEVGFRIRSFKIKNKKDNETTKKVKNGSNVNRHCVSTIKNRCEEEKGFESD